MRLQREWRLKPRAALLERDIQALLVAVWLDMYHICVFNETRALSFICLPLLVMRRQRERRLKTRAPLLERDRIYGEFLRVNLAQPKARVSKRIRVKVKTRTSFWCITCGAFAV